MLVGAALIVAAGLFIIWRERQLGIRRAGGAQGDDAAGLTGRRGRRRRAMLIYKVLPRGRMGRARGGRRERRAPRSTAPTATSTSRPPAQLAETLRPPLRRGDRPRLLAASTPRPPAAALDWEPSRGGALFPHLYRPLRRADVLWARPIADGPGGPIAPDGLRVSLGERLGAAAAARGSTPRPRTGWRSRRSAPASGRGSRPVTSPRLAHPARRARRSPTRSGSRPASTRTPRRSAPLARRRLRLRRGRRRDAAAAGRATRGRGSSGSPRTGR